MKAVRLTMQCLSVSSLCPCSFACVTLSLSLSLSLLCQFLLSQAHRLQALELLGRFLDLGSWAVHSALTVGIFPYVLKLLGRFDPCPIAGSDDPLTDICPVYLQQVERATANPDVHMGQDTSCRPRKNCSFACDVM